LDEDGGSSAAEHAGLNPNAVSFIARFDEEMSLVGYPKAHLFVEARGAADMDLFVLIQKPFDHRPLIRTVGSRTRPARSSSNTSSKLRVVSAPPYGTACARNVSLCLVSFVAAGARRSALDDSGRVSIVYRTRPHQPLLRHNVVAWQRHAMDADPSISLSTPLRPNALTPAGVRVRRATTEHLHQVVPPRPAGWMDKSRTARVAPRNPKEPGAPARARR
jgi:hypothetical protein